MTTLGGIEILLEDGPCFVLLKPGGLLTQAPPHIDSLERRMKEYIKKREEKPGKVYLGVPHRLDRPVSGAMVVARNVRATRRIAEQFQYRTVRKTYLAAVEGVVEPAIGTWTDYLRKVPGEARSEVVDRGNEDAKRAVLHYHTLTPPAQTPSSLSSADPTSQDHEPQITWLRIQLETGRTHQIRVQAASRGFPIVGDTMYGARLPFGPDAKTDRDRWIALHAHHLAFKHPKSRESIEIEAPLPQPWWPENWPES